MQMFIVYKILFLFFSIVGELLVNSLYHHVCFFFSVHSLLNYKIIQAQTDKREKRTKPKLSFGTKLTVLDEELQDRSWTSWTKNIEQRIEISSSSTQNHYIKINIFIILFIKTFFTSSLSLL